MGDEYQEVGDDEILNAVMGGEEAETPSEAQDEEPVVAAQEEPQKVEKEEPWTKTAVLEERRKRQELEQKLAALEQGVQALRPQPEPRDIYEAYDRDAQGVTQQLNAQIKKLVDDDPYGNAARIEQLRDLKDELRRRETVNIQQQLNRQTAASSAYQQLVSVVPDFQNVKNELTRFAIEELGFDAQDLARCDLSNGPAAVKEIIRVNNLYRKLHAKPEQKEARPRPTPVETPGKGAGKVAEDLGQLMKEAQKTGNWERYFDAKGLL